MFCDIEMQHVPPVVGEENEDEEEDVENRRGNV